MSTDEPRDAYKLDSGQPAQSGGTVQRRDHPHWTIDPGSGPRQPARGPGIAGQDSGRSVAHDIGQLAGCGAHLQSLRRTRVGEFQLTDAHTLEEVERAAAQGEEAVQCLFIHPRTLLPSLPTVTANDEIAAKIRHGQVVNLPELSRAREVKVFYGQRDLIAIATRIAGTLFHPKIVLG